MTMYPIPTWSAAPSWSFGEFRFVRQGRCEQHFIPLPANTQTLSTWLLRAGGASRRGCDVYFGLNPRCRKRGLAPDVLLTSALFVDLDGPNAEGELRRLIGTTLEPSIIVGSGHGVHGYWLLCTPMPTAAIVSTGKQLCELLGSDPVWSPAQTPRLPGTANWKDGTPRPVRVLWASERRYDFPILAREIGALAPPQTPNASIFTPTVQLPHTLLLPVVYRDRLPPRLRRVIDDYRVMDRSRADISLTCWAVEHGYDDGTILSMLTGLPNSKLVERMRSCGTSSAQRYAARTLGWARRKVAAGASPFANN